MNTSYGPLDSDVDGLIGVVLQYRTNLKRDGLCMDRACSGRLAARDVVPGHRGHSIRHRTNRSQVLGTTHFTGGPRSSAGICRRSMPHNGPSMRLASAGSRLSPGLTMVSGSPSRARRPRTTLCCWKACAGGPCDAGSRDVDVTASAAKAR